MQTRPSTRTTSRTYQVDVFCSGINKYSGEIIEFTTDFIELRYKQPRKQKFDIKVVSLRDPHLIAIIGDPKGGPGIILMQEDNVPYEDNQSLNGYLQSGPNGLVMIQRPMNPPVLINPTYMRVNNEDVTQIGKTPLKIKRGSIVAPKTMSRPPAGSPAAAAASSDWS